MYTGMSRADFQNEKPEKLLEPKAVVDPPRLSQAAAQVIQRSRKKRKILMLKFLGAPGRGT